MIGTRKSQTYKVFVLILLIFGVMGEIISQGGSQISYFKKSHKETPKYFFSESISPSSGMVDGVYYNHYWDNSSWEPSIYVDNSTYIDYLYLSNGTENVWVEIETLSNINYTYGGDTNYFTFEIFEDSDNSVLSNWKENLSAFGEINWQGYQDYYWNNYQADWAEYSDPNLEQPDYFDDLEGGEQDGLDIEIENGDFADEVSGWWFQDINENDFAAYEKMHETLNGDEKWWFFNLYWEHWIDEMVGSINYIWRDMMTGELIDPSQISWEPVLGYEYDWEMAQMMVSNETIDQKNEWSWFSYDLSQWVSWNDVVSDSINFLTTTSSYNGMSIYNDSNQNGIVDVQYLNETGGAIDYNQELSEYLGYFSIDSIQNIDFQIFMVTETGEIDFSVNLQELQLSAIPYMVDYENYLGFTLDSWDDNSSYDFNQTSEFDEITVPWNLNTSYYLDSLVIECNFLPLNTNYSTFQIKHRMDEILYANNHTTARNEFNGLDLTLDYSVSSNQFSDLVSMEAPGNSYSLASMEMENDAYIGYNQNPIMQMKWTDSYTWGKDGLSYSNSVALTPSYGFNLHYDSLNLGIVSDYTNYLAPYSYSLCFDHWDGYSIMMDPSFTSYLTAKSSGSEFPPPINNNNIAKILIFSFLGVALIFGLLMSKQEYRAFLLNRFLPIETGPHRLTMEDVLENENRLKLIDLIIDQPGIHFSEILRQTNLAPGNLNWHLEILERYKIIKSEIVGKYVMYFPYYDQNPLSTIDLKLQKSKTTMEILEIIQTFPGLTQNEIARRIEKNHKTVKYHLDKLIEANLIEKRKDGRKILLYSTIENFET
ncbi:MAG: winged helix-turn-helix transcriptional regulator [Promethearchaeota archaeon]